MSCKNCKFWYLEKEEHKTGQCRRHAPYTIVAGCGIGESPEYSCSWFFTWPEDWCGEFQKLNPDEGE